MASNSLAEPDTITYAIFWFLKVSLITLPFLVFFFIYSNSIGFVIVVVFVDDLNVISISNLCLYTQKLLIQKFDINILARQHFILDFMFIIYLMIASSCTSKIIFINSSKYFIWIKPIPYQLLLLDNVKLMIILAIFVGRKRSRLINLDISVRFKLSPT